MINLGGPDNNRAMMGAEDNGEESTEASQRTGPCIQRVPRPPPGWNQVGLELGYLLPNLPITIAGFVIAITGFSLGMGLMPLFAVGLIVLAATLGASRAMASFERGRLSILEGQRIGPVTYRKADGIGFHRLLGYLKDPQLWKDWGFQLVSFPIRLCTWSIAVSWMAGAAGGLTYLLWEWALPADKDRHGLSFVLGGDGRFADIALTTALGLFAALTLPYVLRALTATESAVAWAMLTNEDATLRARTRAC